MFPSIGTANDRWHTSRWPCQGEGVSQTLGGSADLLAFGSCHTAADLVKAGKSYCRRTGYHKTVEVDSNLKERSKEECLARAIYIFKSTTQSVL